VHVRHSKCKDSRQVRTNRVSDHLSDFLDTPVDVVQPSTAHAWISREARRHRLRGSLTDRKSVCPSRDDGRSNKENWSERLKFGVQSVSRGEA
jgi:hypothetical protein